MPDPDNPPAPGLRRAGPAETGAPAARHEPSDISVRTVVVFVAALVVAAVVIHAGLWLLFEYFVAREGRGDEPLPPMVVTSPERQPPEPRLQTSPPADMRAMEQAEQEMLTSYGWIDRERGIVRIPIERAMAIIAERGLPARGAQRQEPKK